MAAITVTAMTGDHEFYRRRMIQTTVRAQAKNGWKIRYVDGEDRSELTGALAGNVFSDEAEEYTLLIVENPDKADLKILEEHAQSGDPKTVLLLSYDGIPKKNSKFAKFLDALGKAHKQFLLPPEYQQAEKATEFCLAEAQSYGKVLEETNAQRIVAMVGTDLGLLSFEIQKMAFLAEAEGSKNIRAKHIRAGMAGLGQTHMQPLLDALVRRNPAEVASVLERLRKSEKDPIMKICRFLGAVVLKWLVLADLQSRGMTPEDIAIRLKMSGTNPVWLLKEKRLPQIKLWPVDDLRRFIQVLARTERAVLGGHVSPEVEFLSGILLVL